MLTESKRQSIIDRVALVIKKETCDLPREQAKLYLSEIIGVAVKEYYKLTDKEWQKLSEAEKMLSS